MTNTVAVTPATFTGQEPATVPDRTITYPLKSGGFLAVICPDWCTYDHSDDIERGINPDDLFHQGDKIGLEYTADGVELSILEARIAQWPFDPDEGSPYIEFIPEGRTAASVHLSNPLQVSEEIRKVRAQLRALEELADKLSEAQADDHALNTRHTDTPWASLTHTDLLSMPIAYLIRIFGIKVVETEDIGRKAVVALYGEPGAMELRMLPDLPQQLREDETRRRLLDWREAELAASRG